MDLGLRRLERLRDKRARHQRAADTVRDQIHDHIRSLPATADKQAVARASGLSRPTVYRLLAEGAQENG